MFMLEEDLHFSQSTKLYAVTDSNHYSTDELNCLALRRGRKERGVAIIRTNKRAEKGIREKGEEIKVRKSCNGLRNKMNGVSPRK